MRRALVLIAVLALGCGDDSESGATGGTGGATGGSGGSGGSGGATGGSAGTSGGTAGSGGAAGGAAGTGGASGGTGGASGGTGGASGGTGGASGGTGGSGGGGCGFCDFVCCGSACTNTGNDIKNCGGCGTECKGNTPYCDNGACKDKPPCESGTACSASEVCCGKSCCGAGQICCDVPSSVGQLFPQCHTPVGGTCPKGCTSCVCNSPDTPVATPAGNRAIASLREGDLVYSMDRAKCARSRSEWSSGSRPRTTRSFAPPSPAASCWKSAQDTRWLTVAPLATCALGITSTACSSRRSSASPTRTRTPTTSCRTRTPAPTSPAAC